MRALYLMNLFLLIPLTTYVLEFQSPQHHHYIFISMMWISIKIIVIIAIKGIDIRPTVLIIILAVATPCFCRLPWPLLFRLEWLCCVDPFLQKVCMCMMRAQKKGKFQGGAKLSKTLCFQLSAFRKNCGVWSPFFTISAENNFQNEIVMKSLVMY